MSVLTSRPRDAQAGEMQATRHPDADSATRMRPGGLPRTAVVWQVVAGKHGGIVERSGTSKIASGHLGTVRACHAGRSAAEVSSRGEV